MWSAAVAATYCRNQHPSASSLHSRGKSVPELDIGYGLRSTGACRIIIKHQPKTAKRGKQKSGFIIFLQHDGITVAAPVIGTQLNKSVRAWPISGRTTSFVSKMTTAGHNNLPLHAHIDCTNGASCLTMLEATLDACSALRHGSKKESIDSLNSMMKKVFSNVGEFPMFTFSSGTDSNLKIKWITVQESSGQNHTIETLLKKCNLPAKPKHQVESMEWNNLIDEDETTMEAFGTTVGILLLLDEIAIESLSFDPFPIRALPTKKLQLLTDMPTNPSMRGPVTSASILLLKMLTMGSSSESPPLKLKVIGTARLVENDDDASHVREFRLLLGNAIHQDQQYVFPQNGTVTDKKDLWNVDHLVHMEANLDDITGESLAFAVEVLLKKGAIDAWMTPIVMKKGRPAHTLHCLCHNEEKTWKSLLHFIFQHTTTLGIRIQKNLERIALQRTSITVQTPYRDTTRRGCVDVKVGYLKDEIVSAKAEFDHCREISLELGIPIQQISSTAVQEAFAMLADTETHGIEEDAL